MGTSWEALIQARKESVGLQLEAAYRQRLQDAFTQVKILFETKRKTFSRAKLFPHFHFYICQTCAVASTQDGFYVTFKI
jgi:hypothetical protein